MKSTLTILENVVHAHLLTAIGQQDAITQTNAGSHMVQNLIDIWTAIHV